MSTAPAEDVNRSTPAKLVLSGQPTGWAAMASIVRAFDEEKVQDCKEDMDTLLVFAGLFSAVLSAFLIAAYATLQPDPSEAMLYYLERIAVQTASYNYNGATINATAIPSTGPPTFQPSANSVRVNVLWFASLTISLVTASFAMLVKQWLREYLAVEVPSPQARLRVRHFRAPQIERWKVYEIAAALPLLLQLSLGLFFVGLCYFTWSIHETIGHTTLPLVAGWAFCFFAATFLPVFFPQCPYKTTLLKSFVTQLYHGLAPHAQAWFTELRIWDIYVSRVRLVSAFLQRLRSAVVIIMNYASASDEVLVVSDPSCDLDILASVDVIQSNDELLGTTIREALLSAQSEPLEAMRFVLVVLANRVQPLHVPGSVRALRRWPPRLLNLRQMSKQGKDAITDITVSIVNGLETPHGGGRVLSDVRRSIGLGFSILVSIAASHRLSPVAYPFLQDSLTTQGSELCHSLTLQKPGSTRAQTKSDVVLLLRGLMALVPVIDVEVDTWFQCFEGIVTAQIEDMQGSHVDTDPSAAFSWEVAEAQQWNVILAFDEPSVDVVPAAVAFLFKAASSAFNAELIIPQKAYRAISLALYVHSRWYAYDPDLLVDLRRSLRELLNASLLQQSGHTSAHGLMSLLLTMPSTWVKHSSRHLSDDVVVQGYALEKLSILIRDEISIGATLADALMTCFISSILVEPMSRALSPESKRHWNDIFDRLATLIKNLTSTLPLHQRDTSAPRFSGDNTSSATLAIPADPVSHDMSTEDLARMCLFAIHYAELGWNMDVDYETWIRDFSPTKTVFPDELIEELAALTTEHHWQRVRRIKRVRQLRSPKADDDIVNRHSVSAPLAGMTVIPITTSVSRLSPDVSLGIS